jgi:ribosomal protein S1
MGNSMKNISCEQIKSKCKLGEFVQGKVEFYAPFGVFIKVDKSSVKGLIKIPDFLDVSAMSPEMYPEIDTTIGAIVVGYNESNCREIYLNAKPSVLHKSLVPLRIPALTS